jgi:four helix bundle protein
MDKNTLAIRTRQFAVKVFELVNRFPRSEATRVITYQLLRSASSVAANYRAALRAKSKPDFINKLKIVVEEADESNFWLTLAEDVNLTNSEDPQIKSLAQESNELTAIFSASLKTLKATQNVRPNLKS